MKKYRIERLTSFDNDLVDAEEFKLRKFASRHTGVFINAVLDGIETLKTLPERRAFVEGRTDLRQLIIDGNYRLAYQVDNENQVVTLVALKPEWYKMTEI